MKRKINFTLYSNDKLSVITFPKVASRTTQHYIGKNNIIDVDCFGDIPEFKSPYKTDTESKLKKTAENILNKTSDIDILILYRNPIEKMISSTYQDFLSSIDRHDMGHEYFLKKKDYDKLINKHFSNPNEIYDFIDRKNKTWEWSTIPTHYIFDKLELKLLKMLIDNFFETIVYTKNIINMNHSKLILSYITELLDNLDNSKIKLIDIGEYDVSKIYRSYSEPHEDWASIQKEFRNKQISDYVKKKYSEPKYNSILNELLTEENKIYKFIKEHPCNYKQNLL